MKESKITPIISLRMPSSLVLELKKLAEKDHFMDLSEEVRYIIKQKYIEYLDPYKSEINKIKEDLKSELLKRKAAEKEYFVEELKKLLDEVQQNGGGKHGI